MPATRSGAGRVAASTRTRSLVAGPSRRGRVLGAFPSAVYVDLGAGGGRDFLAVETADGLGLPSAATLAAPSSARPLQAVCAGDDAHVGTGCLDLGPLRFDVVRWWSPRRPRTIATVPYDDARLTAVMRLLPALPQELDDRLGSLTSGLAHPSGAELHSAATGLLGLGTGLTPEGDDVLAGLLVTLAAAPATRLLARGLGEVIASQVNRTTTLSAALLRDAADGFAVPALVDLVDALHETHEAGRPTTHRALADVVVRLLAVGHTSGAALAHGAVAAARLHAAMPARPEVA